MSFTLPAGLTLTLANAATSAYSYYLQPQQPIVPPPGFYLATTFTGYDLLGLSENFGLIFTSVPLLQLPLTQDVPISIIVAFRGTDSDSDDFQDLLLTTTPFLPLGLSLQPATSGPAGAEVHEGFYSLYAQGGCLSDWVAMTPMRVQIFSFLQRIGVLAKSATEPAVSSAVTLYSTGHSLGGALSQLLALDLSLAAPDIDLQVLNFASPQVGNQNWCTACDNAIPHPIIRVVNLFDVVPYYPGFLDDSYQSAGQQFATAFFGLSLYNPLTEHSISNLTTVLSAAVWQQPQVYEGLFEGIYGSVILSLNPSILAEAESLATDVAQDVEDVIQDVEDAVEDVVQGVENAVQDVENAFDGDTAAPATLAGSNPALPALARARLQSTLETHRQQHLLRRAASPKLPRAPRVPWSA